MKRLLAYLLFPALIVVTAVFYAWFGEEPAGAVMLIFFAAAATFFMWILVPTFTNEGTTAPIDPDFELPED